MIEKFYPGNWNRTTKWLISAGVDAVGAVSYVIPGIGESLDVIYAPMEAAWIRMAYGGGYNNLMAVVGFAEELGPGTDIFPAALVAHYVWARKQDEKERSKR